MRSRPRPAQAPARHRSARLCARGEDGQILLLTIAYAVVALLLLTVVVSATSVHLDRKALVAVADQAALAGAGALDLDRYYAPPAGEADAAPDDPARVRPPVSLSDSSVVRAVEEHLQSSATREGPLPVLVHAGTPDGSTAEVTLRTVSRPVLISWVTAPWSDGLTLQVTSRARAS